MATVSIPRSAVRTLLYAESTNAGRNFERGDGVSEFEKVLVDKMEDESLTGSWYEACSKLEEKMHDFITGYTLNNMQAQYIFMATSVPDGVADNIKMFIVNYMMAEWMASVRPDSRQRYVDRCNIQMDDLLRKLYKKEPPV